MRNPVLKSVLWTLAVLAGICSFIYFFQWENFKKALISETVKTLSDTDYLTQLGVGLFSKK